MGIKDVLPAPPRTAARRRRGIDDSTWEALTRPDSPIELADFSPRQPQAQPKPPPPPEQPVPLAERYVSTAPFEEEHPQTLAMHCSDGRFSEGVTGLVTDGGSPRFDVLALPGGPALVTLSTANIMEIEMTRAALSFLVDGHGTNRIHLIAHEGCGFYRRRYLGAPVEKILKKQLDDLQLAALWLRRARPKIEVRLHMARPGGVRVVFETIPVDLDRSDPYGI
jgi:hypothetical protein